MTTSSPMPKQQPGEEPRDEIRRGPDQWTVDPLATYPEPWPVSDLAGDPPPPTPKLIEKDKSAKDAPLPDPDQDWLPD